MKKYTFKFKKPEFLLGDFTVSDSVITDTQEKAWYILRSSYENEHLDAEIISTEDIQLFLKETHCANRNNVLSYN
jgi:hypothetical protein